MTQMELKKEIEDTRTKLNTAIAEKCSAGKILDISRTLDDLIKEYMTLNEQNCTVVH